MSVREFQSFAEFAEHLAKAAIAVKVSEHKALEAVARAVEKDAKAQIGSYQPEVEPFPEWAQLAESTQADREQKGYPANEPLLRDGTLRDSIEHEVQGDEAVIGSKLEIAAYQEFGTATIPPRPFIGPAAVKVEKKLHKLFGEAILGAMEYGSAGKVIVDLAEE